jgi:AraC-like DNA-binding protein
MALPEIDVIVRVAGATLLLWATFAPGASRAAARPFFIPLALCLTGFLAGNSPEPELRLTGVAGWLGVILAGYAAVFLWWWCLAVFDRHFRPRGLILGVGLAWIAVASADRGLLGPALDDKGLSWALIGLGLFMVSHLAWRLIRDRGDDLIDRRRDARGWVVALLATQLLIDMAMDVLIGFDWQPQVFSVAQNLALLAFTGWLLSLDLTVRRIEPTQIARDSSPVSASPQREVDPVLLARVTDLMEVRRIHLDPDLTFESFVVAMGAPERTVRRLINRQLGYDHFRSFLNAYRVAAARRRLTDPAHRNDKLIAIALDSGFSSLPSFNRAFRAIEGRPPSAVRASAGF